MDHETGTETSNIVYTCWCCHPNFSILIVKLSTFFVFNIGRGHPPVYIEILSMSRNSLASLEFVYSSDQCHDVRKD